MPKRLNKSTNEEKSLMDLDTSDDECYMENIYCNFGSDFDENESDSERDILPIKRERITTPVPGDSSITTECINIGIEYIKEEFINVGNEYMNVAEDNEFGPWENVTNRDNPEYPQRIPFSLGDEIEGPQIPEACSEPLDFFQLFFTDSLIDSIIEQTNNSAREKISNQQLSNRSTWHKWTPVTKSEFKAFIGVILNMGTIAVPNLQEYWTAECSGRIPFFRTIFRRERFMQIFWMISFGGISPIDQTAPETRKQMVNCYLNHLDSKFKCYFVPGREIFVDESVINLNGEIALLASNLEKRTKWGIRMHVLVDAKSGYTYSIVPQYEGDSTSEDLVRPDLPKSTRIVLHLCQGLLDSNGAAKGYKIFIIIVSSTGHVPRYTLLNGSPN